MKTTDELFIELDYHLNESYDMIRDFEVVVSFMNNPLHALMQPDQRVREVALLIFATSRALQNQFYKVVEDSEYGVNIYVNGSDKPINAELK